MKTASTVFSSDDESDDLDRMRRQLAASSSRPRPRKEKNKNVDSSDDDDDSSLSSSSSSSSSSSDDDNNKKKVSEHFNKKKSRPNVKTDRAKSAASTLSTALSAPKKKSHRRNRDSGSASSSISSSDSDTLFPNKMQAKQTHAGAATAVVQEPTTSLEAKAQRMTAQSSATYNRGIDDDDDDDEFPFLDLSELQAIERPAPPEQQQRQQMQIKMTNTPATNATATNISTVTEPTSHKQTPDFHGRASNASTTSPTMRSNRNPSQSSPQPNDFLLAAMQEARTTGPMQHQQQQQLQQPPPVLAKQPPPPTSVMPVQQQQTQQQQYPPSQAQGPWWTRPAAAVGGEATSQNGDTAPPLNYQATTLQAEAVVLESNHNHNVHASDTRERPLVCDQESTFSGWNDCSQASIGDGHEENLKATMFDSEVRNPEIHSSFCTPPQHRPMPEPMVHYYSPSNRPVRDRKNIPVSQIFDAPVNTLWKSKFDTFNQLQSEIVNTLAYSDDNIVVSAPTGAGKTAVFEMAMARFFSVDLQHNNAAGNSSGRGHQRVQVSKQRKMVYVSPSKALCEERFEDWSTRLAAMQLGIEVAVITGDGDPSEAFRDLASAHLILTTPEKWDSLTRRWTENFFLFGCVKLFMIDEVHLLADSSRGCCLESVVCRMKGIQRAARKVQSTPADIETSR
jgi:hypothetical protein